MTEETAAHTTRHGLPSAARNFLFVVVALAAAASALAFELARGGENGVATFVGLALAASITQLFGFHTSRNQVYHATGVFFLAGVILLPPELLLLLPLVSHVPDWVRKRYAWYIQTFNIANFTLALAAASIAAELVGRSAAAATEPLDRILPALAAVLAYVVLNNVGFAIVLALARGHRPSTIFTGQIFVMDTALASMGVAIADLWLEALWLIPFAVAPLVLLHQSLHLPELQEEAREARQLRALSSVTEPGSRSEEELAPELLAGVVGGRPPPGGLLLLASDVELRETTVGDESLPPEIVSADGAVTALVAATRVAYVLSAGSERFVRDALVRCGVRSLVAVPVVDGREYLGVLHLVSRRARAFSDDDVDFLKVLAERLARQIMLVRTRRELAAAYAIRHGALEASRTGVCVFGADGSARFWNSAFVDLLGIDRRADLRLPGLAGIAGGSVAPRAGEELQFWTNARRCLRVRFSELDGETLVSVDDLTEQVREKETRDRFVAETVAAQDREARRISELLHDDAVQQLTALGLRLELAAGQGQDERLIDLAAHANGIVASLRRLLVDLYPVVLESRGVLAAVDAAADNLRAYGVDVAVKGTDARLPPETEQLAYRLIQEALANVLKHARATRVDVELERTLEGVRCRITDDGVGLDPALLDSALSRGHLGLQLVRDRVDLAGGRFFIESQRGGGTVFAFDLPVAPVQQAERHLSRAAR